MAQPNVKTPAAQKPAATIPSKSPSISSFFSKKTDNTAPSKNEEAKKEDDEEEKKEDDLKPVAITQELNRRQDSVEQAPLEEDDVADVLSKERSSKYPIGTEVKKNFGSHGYFLGKLTVFQMNYYHIVYDDGDEEDLSENEMDVVVGKFVADSKKKKMLKTAPARKKLVSSTSRPAKRPVMTDSKDEPPKKKATPTKPTNKPRMDDSEDDSDEEEFRDDSDDEAPKKKSAFDKVAKRTPSMRASPRKQVKKAIVDVDSDDEEFDEMPKAPIRKRATTRKAAMKKPIVESDSDAEIDDEYNEDDDDHEEAFAVDSVDEEGLSDESDVEESPPPKKRVRASPAAKVAPAKSWSFLDGSQNGKPAPKKKVVAKTNSTDGAASRNYSRAAYSAGDDLPIISAPQDMFDDMISNKLTDGGKDTHLLIPLLKKLTQRPLRVATMCSGTESPILALDMITKSIEDFCRAKLKNDKSFDHLIQIEHVFSCEIEPFKQAYIERNFQPPLLFRDIRELGNDQAYTAYGSLANVPNTPGCVDMLVAGTSCVDYSNLNVKQASMKKTGEAGESKQTFYGMIEWIEKAQPPIVILENVRGAPWDVKVKIMEKIGYIAQFTFVDTKSFYIPHTRQRGYLFAVRRGGQIPKNVGDDWKDLVTSLKRPASASLDAFMFANDDPRVARGRARLSCNSRGESNEERAGRVDWTKCESGHLQCRNEEELGDKRPLTGWSESGKTTMPSFAWNEWANAQVHRIHDLMDINTLRLAKEGVDCTEKTMVWNLSQNVDRDTMGRLGLSQCLTPTGVPYVTNRGGPLVGEELLLLQGIPAENLILTKETEGNLKDLAGNAMSTTVVGACLLSALLLAHNALDDVPEKSSGCILHSLVPRALSPVDSGVKVSRQMGDYCESKIRLGPIMASVGVSGPRLFEKIMSDAFASSRMCSIEGLEKTLPPSALLVCKSCGHTSSLEDETPARKFEEHEFEKMPLTMKRVSPLDFKEELVNILPMRIELHGFNVGELIKPDDVESDFWSHWTDALRSSTSPEADEYRFHSLNRTNIWTATYITVKGSKLELRLSRFQAVWFLFAKAPAKKGDLKDALERPIARMRLNSEKFNSFVDGHWDVCLPQKKSVMLSIKGKGEPVDSWRAKLGILGDFENEKRFGTIQIKVVDADGSSVSDAVDGEYKLLPKCGGACGSMHKRVWRDDDKNPCESTFFFLQSGRCNTGNEDVFVFSTSKHRAKYGEYRDLILQIDTSENYRTEIKVSDGPERVVKAFLPGLWEKHTTAAMKCDMDEGHSSALSVATPKTGSKLQVTLVENGWTTCPEIISCQVPLSTKDKLFDECDRNDGGFMELNLGKSKRIFEDMAFALSRVSMPVASKEWLLMDSSKAQKENGEEVPCQTCAPAKPAVKWTLATVSKRQKFVPLEDGREAAVYEQAVKKRPNPWVVRLQAISENDSLTNRGMLNVQIGCNAFSLVQQALGVFPLGSLTRRLMVAMAEACILKRSADCIFDWRIVPHHDKSSFTDGDFQELRLTSNKTDNQAEQPPGFEGCFPLRKEQRRSLQWMLHQEANTVPFMEEEVVEAVLPNLNWRAEGRAQRPVLVRGGIIADEVGYGKTAITLGLIRASPEVNGEPEVPPLEFKEQYIYTKATLVIVPAHLLGQWPKEIEKFLGKKVKVIVIRDMNSFNNLSVEEALNADIVVANFAVLSGDKYFQRLGRLAGVDPGTLPSKAGGRHFDAVYNECLTGLTKRVSLILNDCASAYASIEEDAKFKYTGDSVRLDKKKAVYKNVSAEEAKKLVQAKKSKGQVEVAKADQDPWGFKSSAVKADHKKMKCPPLEMFFWKRLVVDEFHYLSEKADRARVLTLVLGLKSTFRWCLSGTPPHANFDDAQQLASLLGIHLGKNEVLPGQKAKGRGAKKDDGQTSLEKFSNLLEFKSMQWHERRHELAQSFFDRFVRQNIAEIDEIKCEEHTVIVKLPPAEMAIYLELENHLMSLEMNNMRAVKSKKSSTGDRAERMQKSLGGSKSAEEALLKTCAHFNMHQKDATPLETCEEIVSIRQGQLESCEKDIFYAIANGVARRVFILEHQPDWIGYAKTELGEVEDRLESFLVDVANNNSVTQGADSEVHDKIRAMVAKAIAAAEKSPEDFFGGNDVELDDSEEESKKRKRKSRPKPDAAELRQWKYSLREHMHSVRVLAKELCGRIRSLRYFSWVRDFQLEEKKIPVCSGRGHSHCECYPDKGSLPQEKAGVLSSCGHVGCLKCLHYHADREECIDRSCKASVRSAHVCSAVDLGVDQDDHDHGGHYGAKLSAIVKKIKELVEQGDRVIVFVQFQDLKEKVADSLEERGVKALQVKGTTSQQVKALDVLQKEKVAKDDPRVLLLTMDDESSSGVNLTTCNHAVFVHPLLADSQQQYDAYETQAIGRIRRFGQTKTVNIWRFLASGTIDATIYKERTGKTVI